MGLPLPLAAAVEVITDRTHLVHVSGHPRRDELEPIPAANVAPGTGRWSCCNIFLAHTSSVTNFEDALEHDADPYREARHAEDQASRCLVSSEYTDQ